MNLLDFADHEYINLITYKKDDTSVKTPVWVAEHEDYLVTVSYTHLTLPTTPYV